MPAFLLSIASNWRVWVGLGVVGAVLAGWLYVSDLRQQIKDAEAENAGLKSSLAEQEDVNRQNLQAITDMKALASKSEQAVSDDAKQQVAQAQIVTQIKERIVHVPVPANACETVGPELGLALDELRSLTGGNTPAGQSASGKGGSTGPIAVVPARAAGPHHD